MRNRLEVIWSIESVNTTDQIINYLFSEWSEKEVKNFLEALRAFEEIVSLFLEVYPNSQIKKGYRRAVIVNQVSVLYSLENDRILIHTVFDNRQDPDKLTK